MLVINCKISRTKCTNLQLVVFQPFLQLFPTCLKTGNMPTGHTIMRAALGMIATSGASNSTPCGWSLPQRASSCWEA